MKHFSKIITISCLSVVLACGNKGGHDHSGHDMNTDGSAQQVLYNQMMDIHDEVMPLSENLYNITKDLKAQLKEAKVDSVKTSLEKRIRYVDSVNNMMMDWMRKFPPLPDTTNEETARVYYETGLEKVKQVKEAIYTALEKEKKPR